MLLSVIAPKKFWAQATHAVVSLINRCPSTATGFKIPEELWCKTPPNYEHLRIFGCVAFAHVNQGKLEPRAKRCMFLEYPEGVKDTSYSFKMKNQPSA